MLLAWHHLARNLRDSVTQSLYSMGPAAQASLRLLDQNAKGQIREAIEHIHLLSQNALAEIREQLYHLHPTALDKEDLVEVLSDHTLSFDNPNEILTNLKAFYYRFVVC